MVDRSLDEIKIMLPIGSLVIAKVYEQKPFGILVELEPEVQGIVERIGMSKQGYSFEDFPVGSTLQAEVLGVRDWSMQVELRVIASALQDG